MAHWTTVGLALILTLTVTTTRAVTVYRWTDENGGVHYGYQAPAEAHGTSRLQLDERKARPGKPPPNPRGARHNESRPDQRPTTTPKATETADLKRCVRLRKKHQTAEARMRAGYKASQYNALESERREHRQAMMQACRGAL